MTLWPEIEWAEFQPPGGPVRGWYKRKGNEVIFAFDEPWWLEPETWTYTVDEDYEVNDGSEVPYKLRTAEDGSVLWSDLLITREPWMDADDAEAAAEEEFYS